MIKSLDKLLRATQYGSISCSTPDGSQQVYSGAESGPAAEVTIHNWSALRAAMLHGDVGIARSYQAGHWDSADLPKLLNWALLNENSLYRLVHGSFIGSLLARIAYLFRANTLKGSKRNIAAHYDLGNDFYQHMLDPSMSYSSGIYPDADTDLSTAQARKYQRVLQQINSDKGNLLEIGCGWGAFASSALQHGDYDIKAITLSEQQYAYSKQLLSQERSVEVALEDYRIQRGSYQSIVSIEMLEAIGERQWPQYFNLLSELLRKSGRALVQTITIKDELFQRYRASGDAIRSYIFPGGMLPNPSSLHHNIATVNLKLLDYYEFGSDYARTLSSWLDNLSRNSSQIKQLGYPESLIRLWSFYLSYCMAGFATERINVAQLTLERP